MRLAILSDIHGNLTAFEAVLRDLRNASPDLILHGGDLPHGGSSPVEIMDRIRDLGWPGVLGNTDEMLFDPEALTRCLGKNAVIEEMAAFTRTQLGPERIEWLRGFPVQLDQDVQLMHASVGTTWRAPGANATDEELDAAYSTSSVYGHIHHPFVRTIGNKTVINTGSVGLPFDGDPRAAYLMLENGRAEIRRVEYNVDAEIALLRQSGLPHSEWVVQMLLTASPVMP